MNEVEYYKNIGLRGTRMLSIHLYPRGVRIQQTGHVFLLPHTKRNLTNGRTLRQNSCLPTERVSQPTNLLGRVKFFLSKFLRPQFICFLAQQMYCIFPFFHSVHYRNTGFLQYNQIVHILHSNHMQIMPKIHPGPYFQILGSFCSLTYGYGRDGIAFCEMECPLFSLSEELNLSHDQCR